MEPKDRTAPKLTITTSTSELEEKYSVIGVLGKGGMGEVILAEHKLLGTKVAIKRLSCPNGVPSDSACERFKLEAKAAQRLHHPNIARVDDFGIDLAGAPYTVMEYIEGTNLLDILSAEKSLSLHRTARLMQKVSEALHHAHERGIVHRDVKPSNIIVRKEDGEEEPVIVDFGIAKVFEESAHQLTQTGEIFGTPTYFSPEQALGQSVDARSDIYSIGCVIFECIKGAPPFGGLTPVQLATQHVASKVPPLFEEKVGGREAGMADLVSKCLEKDPKARFQTARELAAELSYILSDDYRYKAQHAQPNNSAKLACFAAFIIITIFFLCSAYFHFNPKNSSGDITPSPSTAQDSYFGLSPGATRCVSDYVKESVRKDMTEALALFNNGKFSDSAYRMLGCVSAIEAEIKVIDAKLPSTKDPVHKADLLEARRSLLNWLKEDQSNAGLCFLRQKNYDLANKQFEACISYFKKHGLRGNWHSPLINQTFEGYIETLKKTGQLEKATEVQKDYDAVLTALKAH